MSAPLHTDLKDHIFHVMICRPERRNAVDHDTAIALYRAFKEFDSHPDAFVAVLSGQGDHFCAGADLQALSSGVSNPLNIDGDLGPMGPTRLRLSKPVIAAVEGYAVAGGIEMALWCDLRVASETAKFGVFCRRFGVPLIDLGSVRLPRIIGHSRAMDLILTGREVDATEAHQIGLANRIAPAGKALDTAMKLAADLTRLPQQCMRNDRRSALEQWGMEESEALRNEIKLGLQTIESGETQEGAGRFASGLGRHGTDLQPNED